MKNRFLYMMLVIALAWAASGSAWAQTLDEAASQAAPAEAKP